jgi:hypothetical protein
MRTLSAILVAVPALLGGLAPTAVAADNYTYFTDRHYRGSTGDQSYGLATGVLVCEQKLPAPPIRFRPIAWFGAVKPTDGKGRFLYLLIFKTPANFVADSFRISFDGRGSSDTGVEGAVAVRVGTKMAVEVAYKFATDPMTHAVQKQSLTVGGREVKADEPRVFVVDLTGEKVTYTPVKVGLPKEAPDVSESKHDTWGPAVQRAVDQLKKDSPELKKLLDVTK